MKTLQRMAHAAIRVLRLPFQNSAKSDIQPLKRRANAQLRTRLSRHLLRDIGADDG
jgi:hypothetical protein